MEIKGRSLIEGIPKAVNVDDSEIRESLSDSVGQIVSAIGVALERTPPELSADVRSALVFTKAYLRDQITTPGGAPGRGPNVLDAGWAPCSRFPPKIRLRSHYRH